MAHLIFLNNPCYRNFHQTLGMSFLLPYTLVSSVLDFIQMVLAVWKNLEMGIIIILNNSE